MTEDQTDVEDETDEEEMENVNLYDERELHWRMVFEDNAGGVDDAKELIHAKRWYVYVNEKEKIVKGGYLVEVVVNEGVMGPWRGSLGASIESADWRVRVFWSYGLVDRPSDRLYVHTIPMSGCMDRHSH